MLNLCAKLIFFFFYDNKFDASAQVVSINLKTLCQDTKPNNNTTEICRLQVQLVMEVMFKGQQRVLAGNIEV